MKKWQSILLLFLFVSNTLSILAMSTWYMQDRDYFIKNFCVNTEKKELNCNGRCHLQKQFREDQNSKSEQIAIPVLELEFTCNCDTCIPERLPTDYINHQSTLHVGAYTPPTLSKDIPPPNII